MRSRHQLTALLSILALSLACLGAGSASAHGGARPLLVYKSHERNGFSVTLGRRGRTIVYLEVKARVVCRHGEELEERPGGVLMRPTSMAVGRHGWIRDESPYTDYLFRGHFDGGRVVGVYLERQTGDGGEDHSVQEEEEGFKVCGNASPRGRLQHFAARLVSVDG
jgi:hypothetical protein